MLSLLNPVPPKGTSGLAADANGSPGRAVDGDPDGADAGSFADALQRRTDELQPADEPALPASRAPRGGRVPTLPGPIAARTAARVAEADVDAEAVAPDALAEADADPATDLPAIPPDISLAAGLTPPPAAAATTALPAAVAAAALPTEAADPSASALAATAAPLAAERRPAAVGAAGQPPAREHRGGPDLPRTDAADAADRLGAAQPGPASADLATAPARPAPRGQDEALALPDPAAPAPEGTDRPPSSTAEGPTHDAPGATAAPAPADALPLAAAGFGPALDPTQPPAAQGPVAPGPAVQASATALRAGAARTAGDTATRVTIEPMANRGAPPQAPAGAVRPTTQAAERPEPARGTPRGSRSDEPAAGLRADGATLPAAALPGAASGDSAADEQGPGEHAAGTAAAAPSTSTAAPANAAALPTRFAEQLQALLPTGAPAAPERTAHTVTLAAGPQSPEFAPALGAQVTLLAREGVQQARIELNPAEMGPVLVQIALDGGGARVDFHAEVAATRQAIEASLPALAGSLREAGMTLTGGGVFQQSPGRQGGDGGSPRTASAGGRAGHADDGTASAAVPRALARRGLVDLVA